MNNMLAVDELNDVTGGIKEIVMLFRYECCCGFISETMTEVPPKLVCEICNKKNTLIRYAYVNGVWIKMDE